MARISANQMDADLRKAVRIVSDSLKSRLLSPTRMWHHPVIFTMTVSVKGGDLLSRVMTLDDEYFWLDGGTKERWAVMTNPFQAKTKVNSFSSSAGVGGFSHMISRHKGAGPLPGIDARNWTPLAAQEYGPVLQAAVDKEVGKIVNPKRLFTTSRKFRGFIQD